METAIQSSTYIKSTEHAGWLFKRGFKWRKAWNKRWIALHGWEVAYMDKEPTAETIAGMKINKAQLTGSAEIIDNDDPDGDPNGFSINFNDGQKGIWYLRAESKRDKKFWILRLQYALAIVQWFDEFEKVRILGVGVSGIVHELRHKKTGDRCALKEMEIKNKYQMDGAVSEAGMLKDIMEYLSHPNVIHIDKVFQVGSKFLMIFPLCTGGELYEHIVERGRFTEHDAAVLARDLISGIDALHKIDILHLDIKPENILFETKEKDAKIKITDFGLAKLLSAEERKVSTQRFSSEMFGSELRAFMETGAINSNNMKGTIGYMSPELILAGHTSEAADVFAAGVVIFILLSGRPPFHGANNREVINKTVAGNYSMSGREWHHVSSDAKDLVRKMLASDPYNRITIPEILAHPWIASLPKAGLNTTVAQDTADNLKMDASSKTAVEDDDSSFHSANGTLENENALLDAFTHDKSESQSNPKPSDTEGENLDGALELLNGHVNHVKSMKLAAGLSELMTQLQLAGDESNSTLSNKYLISLDISDDSAALANQDKKFLTLMAAEWKVALTRIIENLTVARSSLENELSSNVSANKKLGFTTDEFLALLEFLQYTAPSDIDGPAKSIHVVKSHPIGAVIMTRFIDRDGDGFITLEDILSAQDLMAKRSRSFIKLIFRLYSEALWYPGKKINALNIIRSTPNKEQPFRDPQDRTETGEDNDEYRLPVAVVEPPKFITGKHIATVFDRFGYDGAKGEEAFNVLCVALRKMTDRESEYGAAGRNSELRSPDKTGNEIENIVAVDTSDSERDDMEAEAIERGSLSHLAAAYAATATKIDSDALKMDVEMFSRAANLDDILVHAVLRRPRAQMVALMRRAAAKSQRSEEPTTIAAEVEKEIMAALSQAADLKRQRQETTLGARGRATISAAFEFAQNLLPQSDQVDSSDESDNLK